MNIENWPGIIGEAGKTSLGAFALMVLVIATVALVYFKDAQVWVRLFVFLLLFTGASMFGFAITQVANSSQVTNSNPSPSSSHQAPSTRLFGSCQEIKDDNSSTKDGPKQLKRGDNSTYEAYCDMTTDGGGWTLVAKVQKDTSYWQYNSPSWTAQNANFNDTDFDLMSGEARYPSFERVSFTQIRVLDPINNNKMIALLSADNLLSVFSNSKKRELRVILDPQLFTYVSSRRDDIWNVCKKLVGEPNPRIRINDEENYPLDDGAKGDNGDV